MDPVSTATSAVKSAFSLRLVLQILVVIFLVNLIVGIITRFWPEFGRVFNSPSSYLFQNRAE